jgi:hypothetical protein
MNEMLLTRPTVEQPFQPHPQLITSIYVALAVITFGKLWQVG